jgi:hypothetical protein
MTQENKLDRDYWQDKIDMVNGIMGIPRLEPDDIQQTLEYIDSLRKRIESGDIPPNPKGYSIPCLMVDEVQHHAMTLAELKRWAESLEK